MENTEWTLCSRELPKESGSYLVTKMIYGLDKQYHYLLDIAYFDIDSGWHRVGNVIAWTTAPKPYKPSN